VVLQRNFPLTSQLYYNFRKKSALVAFVLYRIFQQKKVETPKILNGQKSSKNGCRSSLGSKEALKNHF